MMTLRWCVVGLSIMTTEVWPCPRQLWELRLGDVVGTAPQVEGEGPKGADDSLAPETEDKGAVNQAKAGEILLGELTYGR